MLTSLRAVDDVNLGLRQEMRIIMEGDAGNRNSAETTDSDQDDDKGKDRTEDDKEVSELMDRVVRAVSVAKQDKFPYLQHPGRIVYLKKRRGDSRGDGDVGEGYVALGQDGLRVPHTLYLLGNMITDHKSPGYRHALLSLQEVS